MRFSFLGQWNHLILLKKLKPPDYIGEGYWHSSCILVFVLINYV